MTHCKKAKEIALSATSQPLGSNNRKHIFSPERLYEIETRQEAVPFEEVNAAFMREKYKKSQRERKPNKGSVLSTKEDVGNSLDEVAANLMMLIKEYDFYSL